MPKDGRKGGYAYPSIARCAQGAADPVSARNEPTERVQPESEMNHHTIEFLARDHIAELRGDAHRPLPDADDPVAPPRRWGNTAVRRVVTRLAVAALMSLRHA